MATFDTSEIRSTHPDNVRGAERWLSLMAGAALLASAARGGGIVGRMLRGGAGVSLLSRGATGYCAMKSALQGQSTMRTGLQEQWQRMTSGVGGAMQKVQQARKRGATQLDSMESLYTTELQELHSAEQQFIVLSRELMRAIDNSQLAFRIEEYATELQARKADLDMLLAREPSDQREHSDDAMRALIEETHKMAGIQASNVRDAAIAASIQRIIHYKIAGYGTIAAYAKAIGRSDAAARFAQMADRDKTIDEEITELAKSMLNPEAVIAPQEGAAGEMRTH